MKYSTIKFVVYHNDYLASKSLKMVEICIFEFGVSYFAIVLVTEFSTLRSRFLGEERLTF